VTRAVPFVQADIFTTRPFAGNPAGVVLDADGLAEAEMRSIAAEMRLAGTAFVTRPTRPGAAFRLRYLSPTREITYSGHTTLGAVHALIERGRLGPGEVIFDTAVGLLPVTVEPRDGVTVMWLAPPVEPPRPLAAPLPPLLAALGLTSGTLGDWAKAAVTADRDVLLAISGLYALRALRPDMAAIAALASAQGLRGLCMVSRETVEPGSTSHCRFFAPHFGIPEDVVTGSVHSPLALWLAEAGVVALDRGRAAFTAEQGDLVGRPGRLLIEMEGAGGAAPRVRVGGSAVTVLSGSFSLSPLGRGQGEGG
jgi:trans-2,3-dihydro-3-hydroxyanthranilate isomerase